MRVKYLQGMGEIRGPGIRPGAVRDIDDDEAERLIEKGFAEESDAELTENEDGLTAAAAAPEPSASTGSVDVPADVTPGETPGWPADDDGEALDIPNQVRDELAQTHRRLEVAENKVDELVEKLAAKEKELSETTASSKAAGGKTTASKAGKAKTATSKAGKAKTKTGRSSKG